MMLNTKKKQHFPRIVIWVLGLMLLSSFTCSLDAETDPNSPPLRFNGGPSGTIPEPGTRQVKIFLSTSTDATCRYSRDTTRVAYDAMTGTFAVTGKTSHSFFLSNLNAGQAYNLYVRCKDESGHINEDDFPISFTVSGATGKGKLDKVLFIGNSYTGHSGGIHNHFQRLMAAAGKSIEVAGQIHGGEAFSYKNKTYRGFANRPEVQARIESNEWDAVILQSYYEQEKGFYKAGEKLIDQVKNNGSDPILFMIWGHELHPKQDTMFTERAEQLGKMTNSQVAPIGIGIRAAKEAGLDVYLDGGHLSLDGAYFSGAMFYSIFTHESSVGLNYSGYSWNDTLSKKEARKLQTLAWKIVREYGVFYNELVK